MLGIIGLVVGCLGFWYGIHCYYELWKWARQCQNTRIAIAYKRRVKSDMPLTEYLLWANQLDRDKDAKGRVIYQIGGTAIAFRKTDYNLRLEFRDFLRQITKRIHREAQVTSATEVPGPKVREGHWKGIDETDHSKESVA